MAQQVQVLSAKADDHMCDPWNTNDRKKEQSKSKLFPDPDISIMELMCLHIFTWEINKKRRREKTGEIQKKIDQEHAAAELVNL